MNIHFKEWIFGNIQMDSTLELHNLPSEAYIRERFRLFLQELNISIPRPLSSYELGMKLLREILWQLWVNREEFSSPKKSINIGYPLILSGEFPVRKHEVSFYICEKMFHIKVMDQDMVKQCTGADTFYQSYHNLKHSRIYKKGEDCQAILSKKIINFGLFARFIHKDGKLRFVPASRDKWYFKSPPLEPIIPIDLSETYQPKENELDP